jgi:hypothetical protein
LAQVGPAEGVRPKECTRVQLGLAFLLLAWSVPAVPQVPMQEHIFFIKIAKNDGHIYKIHGKNR